MKHVFFFLMALGLSGCLKISDKVHEESAEILPFDGLPHVLELSGEGQYQVFLPYMDGTQTVRRTLKSDEKSLQSIPIQLEGRWMKDSRVQSGQTYLYEIGSIQNGEFQGLQSFEVTIPKDLVIRNEISLQKDESWTDLRRIYFKKGGILTTNGHHLEIIADQIYSDSGVIRTFPKGARAQQGSRGANGGLIEISMDRGQGILFIELRGQQGGHGKDGASIPVDPTPHLGFYKNGPIPVIRCEGCRPQGKPGEPGGDGFPGGNSGRAEIKIAHSPELAIQHQINAGGGGPGGIGGAGEPATPFVPKAGNKGSDGQIGGPGTKESICIQNSQGDHCESI